MITNELVIKSIDYIMEHLEEEILIEEVADHCHLSKYYFCRVFKKIVGYTPSNYRRLNQIKGVLINEKESENK